MQIPEADKKMKESSEKPPKMTCQICGRNNAASLKKAFFVRPSISYLIRKERGTWDEGGWICTEDLQKYRHLYVENIVTIEKGELTEIERAVIDSLHKNELLSKNPDIEFEGHRTLGQRLADRIASFGGSWVFISLFAVALVIWIVINTYILAARPFDPYPYILLNLILSCIAAIQAPVIMMSQNRQESRDRMRAIHDYQVNLKAELEIRHLDQKIDHLLTHQWERLVEIQQIQMELVAEVRERGGKWHEAASYIEADRK